MVQCQGSACMESNISGKSGCIRLCTILLARMPNNAGMSQALENAVVEISLSTRILAERKAMIVPCEQAQAMHQNLTRTQMLCNVSQRTPRSFTSYARFLQLCDQYTRFSIANCGLSWACALSPIHWWQLPSQQPSCANTIVNTASTGVINLTLTPPYPLPATPPPRKNIQSKAQSSTRRPTPHEDLPQARPVHR